MLAFHLAGGVSPVSWSLSWPRPLLVMEGSKSFLYSVRAGTEYTKSSRGDECNDAGGARSSVRRNEQKQTPFDHLNFLRITARALERAARTDWGHVFVCLTCDDVTLPAALST